MSLDWIDYYHFAHEVNSVLRGAKVEKVYQPMADHLQIELYGQGRRCYLNLAISQKFSCAFVSGSKSLQPEEPSSYCMLLRKHLTGKFLRNVTQPENERMIFFEFEAAGLLNQLVVDLRGRVNNTLLCDDQLLVLGFQDKDPQLKVGFKYQWEAHPVSKFVSDASRPVSRPENWQDLLKLGRQITPKLAQFLMNLSEEQFIEFMADFEGSLDLILTEPVFEIWADELGPQSTNMIRGATHVGQVHHHKNVMDLLAEFCSDLRDNTLLRQAKERAFQSIHKRIKVLSKKQSRTLQKLEEYKSYPEIEKMASLLNSQRDKIKPFHKSVTLTDFYGDYKELEVEIDPRQSAQGNVDKLFKKARKFRRGIEKLEAQLVEIKELNGTLDRNLQELRHITDFREVDNLLLRLQNLGLVNSPQSKSKSSVSKKKKAQRSRLRMFLSSEGLEIYAGRNNSENDYLIRSVASKDDLWFHVKDCPGAHVLLRVKDSPGKASKLEAAQLAAFLSRKKNDAKAEVMYTTIKHVQKLPGMKPGEVSLRQFESMLVRLDVGILSKLEKNVHQVEG